MMLLSLSILCSTINHLMFKAFQRLDVAVLPAIVVNYLVCIGVGYLSMEGTADGGQSFGGALLLFAVLQGALLIGSFFLMSATTRKNGVGVAALAARLAVILPTVTAFFLYGDSAHGLKLAGIGIAVVALYLGSFEKDASQALDRGLQPLPIALFLSFGMNLVLAKYVQVHHLDRMTYHGYLMYAFGFAFLSGLVLWVCKRARGRPPARRKDILAGVLLGVNNYGSLYFMIRTIAQPGWESSVVFPTISASVVMLSFLGAFAIFGERASRRKLTALVVGVAAIVLINSR